MTDKLKALFQSHREMLLYIFFGGLTTLVDWSISFILYHLNINVHFADVVAWVAAVLFAYVTNRIWVFASRRHGFLPILIELFSFAGGRVLTLLLQEALVWVFYDKLSLNKYIVKITVAVFVVVLNYFISKLIVFRCKTHKDA